MSKIESYMLSLAGEYRVCSELIKRGIFATVTYGNRKSVDVYALDEKKRRTIKIEVKTSQKNNFVTMITQKNLENSESAPDFWVLFHLRRLDDDTFDERFFVLTHREICQVQAKCNADYLLKYKARHDGKEFDMKTGIDNVRLTDVGKYENAWKKITRRIQSAV